MEVGAVKQAFNNELILLKKKLNQAKIQIIHKLTRKAKTFTEKKGPEPLKEKLKRKAESAVNEVLIIKKIKPKDLARFAVTHKGQLNDYLNKPNVDQEKACARLLLHKLLQDKYKLIRTRFCSIPIEDLLMSREERKKIKKEAREKQKNKKKEKENKGKNVVNAEGVWEVEDMNVSGSVNEHSINEQSDIEEGISEDETETVQNSEEGSVRENNEDFSLNESDVESNSSQDNEHSDTAPTSSESENEKNDETKDAITTVSNIKQVQLNTTKKSKVQDIVNVKKITNDSHCILKDLPQKNPVMKSNDKSKSNKNKNLNEKLLSRKFKKDFVEAPVQETKIVDSFFITSTGENYLSVVEPRPPDEVKEIHKQGNRKLRRAAMFGHVPKIKPRQHVFEADDSRFNKHNGFSKNNNSNRYNNREDFSNVKRNVTNKRNKFESNEQQESKPEKLHPSWEAKKRQSGIQPFQGKKIVFDEN